MSENSPGVVGVVGVPGVPGPLGVFGEPVRVRSWSGEFQALTSTIDSRRRLRTRRGCSGTAATWVGVTGLAAADPDAGFSFSLLSSLLSRAVLPPARAYAAPR